MGTLFLLVYSKVFRWAFLIKMRNKVGKNEVVSIAREKN
jgi:hypothetical protein